MKNDPYDITGRFYTDIDHFCVVLETNNPTSQERDGQAFVQKIPIYGEPKNILLAKMLKNLAHSVEFEWENLNKT
jgi:hypothetical protein